MLDCEPNGEAHHREQSSYAWRGRPICWCGPMIHGARLTAKAADQALKKRATRPSERFGVPKPYAGAKALHVPGRALQGRVSARSSQSRCNEASRNVEERPTLREKYICRMRS